MSIRPDCIERAFALAQSGTCGNVQAIRDRLKSEGYSAAGHLSGGSIRGQLTKLIAAARTEKTA